MNARMIEFSFILLAMTLLSLPASAGWSNTVYEADSLYHHIRVVDDGGVRMLRFDNSIESKMQIANPYAGHFEYVDYFFQSFVLNKNINNCLILGLGGASAPKLMQKYFRDVDIDIVEIDEMVYDVAQEYFGFTPAENTNVTIQDARVALRKSDSVYDLILMDAYTANKYGSYVPFHLATLEFFNIVDDHMSDNGVFGFNVIGTLFGDRKEIVASIYRTMSEVFPNIYIFTAKESQNVVFLASKNKAGLSKMDWSTTASALVNNGDVGIYPQFLLRATSYYDSVPQEFWDAKILTDDFAPVDGLLK